MDKNIKTIIFDLGGVLYDLDRERCVSSLEKVGLNGVDQMLTNYKQSGVFQQLEDGSIEANVFYDGIRKMIGYDVSDEEIKAAWDSFLVDIPDNKLKLVDKLRKKYQIFMLSNTNEIHFGDAIPKAFQKHGKTINDYFDRCYLSYEMKTSKPNKLIFNLLIEDSGINPHETLFIDDSPENIRVANEIGFHTYLAKPFEDFSHLFDSI